MPWIKKLNAQTQNCLAGQNTTEQNAGAERGPQTPNTAVMQCCTRKLNLILECLDGSILSKGEQTFQVNSVAAR